MWRAGGERYKRREAKFEVCDARGELVFFGGCGRHLGFLLVLGGLREKHGLGMTLR